MADAIDSNWSVPLSFFFQVTIGETEIAFKEVSGLTTEMELETVQEGGVNEYEHRLPKQIKHGNLILKRALMPITNNEVVQWVSKILDEGSLFKVIGRETPLARNIKVTLLTVKGKEVIKNGKAAEIIYEKIPVYQWECLNAFPVKWEIEALDAEKNTVLIEILEFAYSTLMRLDK